jgi:ParB-like chromosome segregation protein Spo0J
MKNVKIGLIKPYEKNAKKHPAKQIKQVAESIKEFGFNQPIVVDKQNVIIVGHGRYEAAKLLGLKDVPTITVDLTEEKAKAYRLADNLFGELVKDLLIEPDEKDDIVPDNAPTSALKGKKPNDNQLEALKKGRIAGRHWKVKDTTKN